MALSLNLKFEILQVVRGKFQFRVLHLRWYCHFNNMALHFLVLQIQRLLSCGDL